METQNLSIGAMLDNYKKTPTEEIQKLLKKVKIVKLTDKGVGSIRGYYQLSKSSMTKMIEKPRNISLTFDATDTENLLENIKPFKRIAFYIKSSSRFFLKPDIGEVFDQMSSDDKKKTKAICVNLSDYNEVGGTDGEHFIMTADLLN